MSKVLSVVARELREALPAFLFFFVAFHMVAVTKAVVLEDYRISGAGAAVATVGALIVAKAILLVRALPLCSLFRRRLIWNILWKTLLFGAVVMVFRYLEELIPLLAKHDGLFAAARKLHGETSWPHFWVVQMWLFALLFLYTLASDLAHVIGATRVREALLHPRNEPS